MLAANKAPARRRSTDAAIRILLHLTDCGGTSSPSDLVDALDVPRSTLYRVIRSLAKVALLDLGERGCVTLGALSLRLVRCRDDVLRAEDAGRVVPRTKVLRRAPATSFSLGRHAESVDLVDCRAFRRMPKFKLGFANAAVDSPWRIALVHSVEYGAVKYRDWIRELCVRHAGQDSGQSTDIDTLLARGVDGLIVSAASDAAVAPALARAERMGVPTILVDRGLPDRIPHASFVTCDDDVIGRTTALWLAEQLGGHGSIVLLPGLAEAEPARRRLAGARRVLEGFPEIEVLATEWTSWQSSEGRSIMQRMLADYGTRISGVWCDSGLQAVGSLQAFMARRRTGPIPPHTGGDLNLAYKLALRHHVPLAAVDYPPAMGLRAVEIMLDVLRGRIVPRRVDVGTEIVVTRGDATASVRPDLWAEDHVRWDLPDDLVLASGLGLSYDPRSFRIRYNGNRYNRSAAARG